MAHYTYQPKGVCSREISFDIENDVVQNVKFVGGCNGNLQGISRLVEGLPRDKVIEILQGVNCNGKGTSCPDQLVQALLNSKEA
uniref:ribonucleoside-diphosphate reductase n=1 Tax=uncultured Bacillota bacterium TaxID=344338 RepID=A0A650EMY3_9FIRM|nr:TSCPD domain-containing protein [uncultured Firmicutes bacterium]